MFVATSQISLLWRAPRWQISCCQHLQGFLWRPPPLLLSTSRGDKSTPLSAHSGKWGKEKGARVGVDGHGALSGHWARWWVGLSTFPVTLLDLTSLQERTLPAAVQTGELLPRVLLPEAPPTCFLFMFTGAFTNRLGKGGVKPSSEPPVISIRMSGGGWSYWRKYMGCSSLPQISFPRSWTWQSAVSLELPRTSERAPVSPELRTVGVLSSIWGSTGICFSILCFPLHNLKLIWGYPGSFGQPLCY
jgi:hypothetical protein